MFRLILVEDEPRILRHLKEKISTLRPDFKVIGAYNNGEDALVEFHWTQPQAILTDIRMPVMDGLELLTKVRVQFPDIPCAILSGYDDFAYLREAIKLGVTDYLLKPATDEAIIDILDKIKEKLLKNMTLLEYEAAKQIVQASDSVDLIPSEWIHSTKELFFHGNYVLVYAWSPTGDLPLDTKQLQTMLRLEEKEKLVSLPSGAGNEVILLFGLHGWSEARCIEWNRVFKENVELSEGVSVALALSLKGMQPIPQLLAECKKQTRIKSRFNRGTFFWIDDSAEEVVNLISDSLQSVLVRLAQFVSKQQKQLFHRELDSLFIGTTLVPLPDNRRDWELLLLHASHLLHTMCKDSFTSKFDLKRTMETELKDEVWKLKKSTTCSLTSKKYGARIFFVPSKSKLRSAIGQMKHSNIYKIIFVSTSR